MLNDERDLGHAKIQFRRTFEKERERAGEREREQGERGRELREIEQKTPQVLKQSKFHASEEEKEAQGR